MPAASAWTVDAKFHPEKRARAGIYDVTRGIHRRETLHLREARCSVHARLIPYTALRTELSPAHRSSVGRGNRMRVTGNRVHHGTFREFLTHGSDTTESLLPEPAARATECARERLCPARPAAAEAGGERHRPPCEASVVDHAAPRPRIGVPDRGSAPAGSGVILKRLFKEGDLVHGVIKLS